MRLKARNRIVTAALVLLLLLVVVGALLSAAPPARADEVFRLTTSSAPVGLATDHARSRYWLLERSSGRLTLTAVAADGTVEGKMTTQDTVTSAQALAFDTDRAWVGDIGGRRAEVVVYLVPSPWPATEILAATAYTFAYPDGKHDASAMLVDPSGRIHIVTSGDDPGIYRAPETLTTDGANALERIADAPAGVTDAVVLQDGRWALRTADSVLTLDAETAAVLGEAEIGVTERGQVLTQGLDESVLLTGLASGGVVTSTAIPGPAPSVSPDRATRTPAASSPTGDSTDGSRTFDQSGTLVALGAAVLAALLAALVAVVRR